MWEPTRTPWLGPARSARCACLASQSPYVDVTPSVKKWAVTAEAPHPHREPHGRSASALESLWHALAGRPLRGGAGFFSKTP